MATETGLRGIKKQRTRDALVDAAFALASEHGIDATTVDMIAERAQVSRRTFFRYFSSKEAVVFAFHPARVAFFRSRLARVRADAPASIALREAMVALARRYMKERDQILLEHHIIETSPALVAMEAARDLDWGHAIADALAARAPSPLPSPRWPRLAAGAVIGAVRAALREWIAGEGRGDLVALGAEALELLERAIDPVGDHA